MITMTSSEVMTLQALPNQEIPLPSSAEHTATTSAYGRVWAVLYYVSTTILKVFQATYRFFACIAYDIYDALRSNDPAVLQQFGYGIKNGGNSCYINAVIQALRFCPSFVAMVQETAIEGVNQRLSSLFAQLTRQTVARSEINDFRDYLISSGFHVSTDGQEDAQAFLQFLLEKVSLPSFTYKEDSRSQTLADNHLIVPIPPGDVKTIQESLNLTFESPPPKFLPIMLRRYTFQGGNIQRDTTAVLPSETIIIPTRQTTPARYSLRSMVVHSGNGSSGHYYMYTPSRDAIVEYNDNRVRLRAHPEREHNDASRNGYLFFYELQE
jgi:ubiquitin C-terminal hydrolase